VGNSAFVEIFPGIVASYNYEVIVKSGIV